MVVLYLTNYYNFECDELGQVMDRNELEGRNKEGRARTEREILEMLDHPFLPTLYASIESPKWSCLLTEFCPGGDLHVLRQRQPAKRFPESAVRYYSNLRISHPFEACFLLVIIYILKFYNLSLYWRIWVHWGFLIRVFNDDLLFIKSNYTNNWMMSVRILQVIIY